MSDQEIAKQNIQELIEKYNQVITEGNVHRYNEEMTKKDFIEPLFEALGWNIHNKPNRNDSVSAEEQISKSKKRADYAFRINGIPKFFLEAKSLKSDLDNSEYIEQAINYAYNKGCTWTILTNFETIRIYNAEWKTENPRQAELKSISVEEYIARFEELWLLSKESFEQGLLDKEAEKWGKKTKKTPIDKQLLADFMRFRELLSKNILKLNSNKNLTEEQLDEAVQRMFDRLIFIRNCEDREFEEKLLLAKSRQHESRNRGQLIKDLREIFSYYDKHYNSKIFAQHLCDDLEIDNEVLQEVIEGINSPKDKFISYDFSAIDADVLGNVYEQYLGYILKKTEKRASLKEAKTKRKEMGIYYTPTYIVEYIVRNTLGELLKDKKVDVSKIRILDPACGSGSFLIKAYDLLHEYLDKEKKIDSKATILPGYIDDNLAYTIKEKILQDNIFGVDLDKQAVEIAQLNLLLKIAQKGQRLPLLEKNIKCGNSLIDDPAIAGDKAFKWEEEFPQVMKEGGFDVIIGNPPYGADIPSNQKEILDERYKEDRTKNTAAYFIFKGLELLKNGGHIAYIVPKQLTYISSWQYVRRLLLEYDLIKIIDASEAFDEVELEQVIFILRKTKKREGRVLVGFSNKGTIIEEISNKKYFNTLRFPLWITEENHSIFDKILVKSQPLSSLAKVNWGGPVAKFLTKDKTYNSIPCIRGREIRRYSLSSEWFIKKTNIVQSYYVKGEKLLFQRIVSRCGRVIIGNYRDARLVGTYSNDDIYADKTVTLIWDAKIDLKYLLGLLNSKLLSWFAHRFLWNRSQLTMEFMYEYARNFPICIPNKTEMDRISEKVSFILKKSARLKEIGDKKTDERAKIEEEIKKTDRETDELVYKLYGITEEEKKIIEESLK